MSTHHVCIDAGGTKVACAIADSEGNIVARGKVGPGNMAEVSVALRSCPHDLSHSGIRRSLARAGFVVSENHPVGPPGDRKFAFCIRGANSRLKFNMSCKIPLYLGGGCDSDLDMSRMSARLEDYFGVPARATNDSLLLASHIITDQIERAASEETSWGVCVVAGTGSVIAGVKVGEDALPVVFGRVGGHGHVFGDEGSAYHLGVTAVRAMANAANCNVDTSQSEAVRRVCETVGVDSPSHLPAILHELDHTVDMLEAVNRRKLRIASLAIPIIASAGSQPDDQLVQTILYDVTMVLAREINQIVQLAGKNRLPDHKQALLCLTGGLAAQPVYMASLIKSLRQECGLTFGKVVFVDDGARIGAEALALSHRSHETT